MKKAMLFIVIFASLYIASGMSSVGAEEPDSPTAVISNHHAALRNFTAGAVTQGELDQILAAGVRAPSAGNRQPWHFTVVRNPALANQIVSNMPDGNILIVISASGDGKTNGREILDCALATQSIYLAAQALGLGSRIYTGPMDTINQRFKADLGLPNGYGAVSLVRIGRVLPGIDAVSAASSRKSLDSIVNYK
ncbi:MAG: nitroreductase family protein [Treponema sp.]|jgi:nitroreductase|nr:nitroreductase family protein [Treponema sp.]